MAPCHSIEHSRMCWWLAARTCAKGGHSMDHLRARNTIVEQWRARIHMCKAASDTGFFFAPRAARCRRRRRQRCHTRCPTEATRAMPHAPFQAVAPAPLVCASHGILGACACHMPYQRPMTRRRHTRAPLPGCVQRRAEDLRRRHLDRRFADAWHPLRVWASY